MVTSPARRSGRKLPKSIQSTDLPSLIVKKTNENTREIDFFRAYVFRYLPVNTRKLFRRRGKEVIRLCRGNVILQEFLTSLRAGPEPDCVDFYAGLLRFVRLGTCINFSAGILRIIRLSVRQCYDDLFWIFVVRGSVQKSLERFPDAVSQIRIPRCVFHCPNVVC